MKSKVSTLAVLLLLGMHNFAQTKIETKDGIHYITNNIEYPVTGTYQFQGTEPVVELNGGGIGFYQLHEQIKKAVSWGIECDESGAPKFDKGFDNAAYILWYQYTNPEGDDETGWKPVEFTIHFNTQKMFIQGERSKDYTESAGK